LFAANFANAQVQSTLPYPSRPVRMVVPYAAGGATDFVARTVSERLSKVLGQPVVVENRSGAAGAIGALEVARAAPDGHTVLMTITDSQINNSALYKTLQYDPLHDFVPITQIVRSPAVLSASPARGIKTVTDLRQRAASGEKLSYGSWGIGGLGHLAGESMNRSLNLNMVHVALRGEAPVVMDLLGGNIDVGWSSVPTALEYVKAGRLVPIAVMGRERSSALPKVPTLRELGFSEPLYETNVWIGLLAPAKTPQPIIDRLAREIRAIVSSPEVTQILTARGFEIMNTSPKEFAGAFATEFDVITRRIRELGIEPQ
jgi:tripartite-type tricarboxylate transporter receptor subunit TctC